MDLFNLDIEYMCLDFGRFQMYVAKDDKFSMVNFASSYDHFLMETDEYSERYVNQETREFYDNATVVMMSMVELNNSLSVIAKPKHKNMMELIAYVEDISQEM